MNQLKQLFTPWNLCGFSISNRICVPPLVVYSWGDETGYVTAKHVDHYRALANGGAGLVIQEATAVCPEGRLTLDQLGIWDDGQIDGLRRISEVLHEAGMPAIIQLSYAGLMGAKPVYRVGPSALTVPIEHTVRTVRALTATEIQRIEQCFIRGAQRAFQAGYDGVELHASHGYLLSEFINRAVNRRNDAYADGMLIMKNVIQGIRSAAPSDFVLGVRLGAFEPNLADGIHSAKLLAQWGVDFIDVFLGCDWASEAAVPAGYPFNASIYGAKHIKEAVDLPVFAVFQIGSGAQAEAILQDTGVDMVSIGRGSLVNYKWGSDVQAGRDPGHCMNCSVCQWTVKPEHCPGKRMLYLQRGLMQEKTGRNKIEDDSCHIGNS